MADGPTKIHCDQDVWVRPDGSCSNCPGVLLTWFPSFHQAPQKEKIA